MTKRFRSLIAGFAGCVLAAVSSSAKKLMACVRPGVEETCACFEPTSAFSRLDLPTFERPRKATSGAEGGGK